MRIAPLILALALSAATGATAQEPAVSGRVLGQDGLPVPGANVFLLETLEGALTDPAGGFVIRVVAPGTYTLVVRALRHREWRGVVAAPAEDLRVELERDVVELERIVVRAGDYIATDEPDAALTALDVVTTPGTQADVYRALQTFPGLQPVDEGAGLFVRGGDVAETKIFLNDAVVLSPYRYESPTGGFFGAFDPFLLDGIHFSSGGFGARWGDALSGVAALDTRGRPARTSMGLTASLAALSGTVSGRMGEAVGVHATATRSHTRLLFDVNGTTSEFTRVPEGRDLSGSVVWRYGQAGEVRVFGIDQWNRLGVVVDEASFSGAFEADERHDMLVASWRDWIGRFEPRVSVATSSSRRDQSFGAFVLGTSERIDQMRAHTALQAANGWTLAFGGDVERRTGRFEGSVPAEDHDVGPDARTVVFASRIPGTRAGVFAEADWWAIENVRVTAGLRADRSTLTDRWTADPRLAAAWRPSAGVTLTTAWGIYHQVPSPLLYEPEIGDTTLGPMRATHWIAGAQVAGGGVLLRVEAYVKRYAELAQETRSYGVAAHGMGSSRGLDIFFRWPSIDGFSGRTSHGFIRARRTDPDAGVVARSPFDISHTSTTVLEQSFGPAWSVAAAYRTGTGRPFTQVIDASFSESDDLWIPQYGPPMAERLPGFRRLDFSASHLRSFLGNDLTVLFVGITNALDRENLHGYRYSADYQTRTPVRSQFRRSIYFGASVTF